MILDRNRDMVVVVVAIEVKKMRGEAGVRVV